MRNDFIIKMVKDLERTRKFYYGYAYVRTMRNILVGKDDAAIAPYFKNEPYYGQYYRLSLAEVEKMMDQQVRAGRLRVIYTSRGKLYCTPEYYEMAA